MCGVFYWHSSADETCSIKSICSEDGETYGIPKPIPRSISQKPNKITTNGMILLIGIRSILCEDQTNLMAKAILPVNGCYLPKRRFFI